jgi:hypothetical protein
MVGTIAMVPVQVVRGRFDLNPASQWAFTPDIPVKAGRAGKAR